jgi:hypothetical protein
VSDDLVKKYWPLFAKGEQTGIGSSNIVKATYGANTGTLTSDAFVLHALAAEQLTVGRPDLGAPALQVSANLAGTGSLTADAVVVRAVPAQTSGTQTQPSGGGTNATTPGSAIKTPNNATVSTAMSDLTREEVDSKFETVVAKTDTKFAELIGEIRVISSDLKGEMKSINTRLDAVDRSTAGVKATIIVVALTAIAIVVGVLAFGQQWFGIGITMRDIIRATVSEERLQRGTPAQSPSMSAPTQNPSNSK